MEGQAGGRTSDMQLTVFSGSEVATSSETKSALKSARSKPSEGRFGRHSLITRNASACITGSQFDDFQHHQQQAGRAQLRALTDSSMRMKGTSSCAPGALNHPKTGRRRKGGYLPSRWEAGGAGPPTMLDTGQTSSHPVGGQL